MCFDGSLVAIYATRRLVFWSTSWWLIIEKRKKFGGVDTMCVIKKLVSRDFPSLFAVCEVEKVFLLIVKNLSHLSIVYEIKEKTTLLSLISNHFDLFLCE